MAVTQNERVYELTASGDSIDVPFVAHMIRWVSKTASAGDDLELSESSTLGSSSNIIWETAANGANYVEESFRNFKLERGLRVNTIDSGSLWVYVSDGDRP